MISIDGAQYRWVVQEDDGYNLLTVQCASGTGQKISIAIGLAWCSPRFRTVDGTDQTLQVHEAVTPSLIGKLVRDGLKLGWTPGQSGGIMRAHLLNSGLTIYSV